MGFEIRRIVVVGPDLFEVGVDGPSPRLRRASMGAGMPGRRVWPGSGVGSELKLKGAVGFSELKLQMYESSDAEGLLGSNVKWSV
jgi:hypothetical protein